VYSVCRSREGESGTSMLRSAKLFAFSASGNWMLRSALHLAFLARAIIITSSHTAVYQCNAHHHARITKRRLGRMRARLSATRFATRERPKDSRRQVQLHMTYASLSAMAATMAMALSSSQAAFHNAQDSFPTLAHIRKQRQPEGGAVSMHHIRDIPQHTRSRLH
jgi:hypothetical protein